MSALTVEHQQRAETWVGVLKTLCSTDDAAIQLALTTARDLPGSDRDALLIGLNVVYRRLLREIERQRADLVAVRAELAEQRGMVNKALER